MLEQRVQLATADTELRQEILQDAIMRIISGEGYCDEIDLRTKQNRKMVYGRFGQVGSDSTTMRRLNGIPPERS